MDACKPIQFRTPAQIAGTIAGLVAIWVALLAICILFI